VWGLLCLWWLIACFWLLSIGRWFSAENVVACALITAAAAWRWTVPQPTARVTSPASAWLQWNPGTIALGVLLGLTLVKTARGLLMPALAWDTVTYHLFFAGRYVQEAGFARTIGADAMGYYAWFPPVGDILWSTCLVFVRNGALLTFLDTAVFLLMGAAAAALAQELGAPRHRLTLVAACALSFPALHNAVTTYYVDILTATMTLTGLTLSLRSFRSATPIPLVIAAFAAIGIGAGTKLPLLPLLALPFLCLLWHTRTSTHRRLYAWLLAFIALLPGTISYVLTWVETGSPLYPFPLIVGGDTLISGHYAMEELIAYALQFPLPRLSELVPILLQARAADQIHFGLGRGFPLLCLASLWGISQTRTSWRTWCVMTVGLLAFALSVSGSGAFVWRLWWADISSRLIGWAWLPICVLGSLVRPAATTFLLLLGIIITLPQLWPNWWVLQDWLLAGFGFLAIIIPGFCIVQFVCTRDRFQRLVAVCVFTLYCVIGGPVIDAERRREFLALRTVNSIEFQLLDGFFAPTDIWNTLHDGPATRLALTAPWIDPLGHPWYRYPLLGQDLQNRVTHIPVTTDGEHVGHFDADYRTFRGDEEAWLQRLRTEQIDRLLFLAPVEPESSWVRDNPLQFRLLQTDGFTGAELYEVTT
jgi:hypothetical protein